ncbi:hypothetical protein [Halomonas sp. YLGW01]|uniref:hypothetical protein n=1 Tax=Halomonas sp. YLGW01 TaxID=2773308 RepID=UPI00177D2138|nr:hypothetical protein [Halomonas sp. YLGW01]
MLNWIMGRKPSTVWVIKQVDEHLLHVCGRGEATGPGSVRKRRKALAEGRYQGPIRLAHSSAELSADLFAALILPDDLEWQGPQSLRWQGRLWRIAWVPPICWAYRDKLTLAGSLGPDGSLVSTEDISTIQAKIDSRATPASPRLWLGLEGLDNAQAPLEPSTLDAPRRSAANARNS